MKVLQIATVGEDPSPVVVGVREFPITKLVLVHTPEVEDVVAKLVQTLAPLKLDIERHKVMGDVLMGVLEVVTKVVTDDSLKYDDVFINVASGTKMMTCAALSAAFVNGVKAIDVADRGPIQLPVLKFSYHELVSDSKRRILKALSDGGGQVDSLNALSELSGVEKSLLSYHIRGGRDSKGLEGLGLVKIDRALQGRLQISITPLGSMLLVGRN